MATAARAARPARPYASTPRVKTAAAAVNTLELELAAEIVPTAGVVVVVKVTAIDVEIADAGPSQCQ